MLPVFCFLTVEIFLLVSFYFYSFIKQTVGLFLFYYISHGKYSYIFMFSPEEQYPSFGAFIKLVILFDISVDQFIHADSGQGESSYRKELVGKLRGHDLHIGGGAPCSPIRKRRLIRKSKLDGAIKSFVESPVAGIWLHVKEKGSVPPGWSWP